MKTERVLWLMVVVIFILLGAVSFQVYQKGLGLGGKIEGMKSKLDTVSSTLKDLDSQLQVLGSQFRNLDSQSRNFLDSIKNIELKVDSSDTEKRELTDRISGISNTIQDLQKKLEGSIAAQEEKSADPEPAQTEPATLTQDSWPVTSEVEGPITLDEIPVKQSTPDEPNVQ